MKPCCEMANDIDDFAGSHHAAVDRQCDLESKSCMPLMIVVFSQALTRRSALGERAK
jgi:hypothetical protein